MWIWTIFFTSHSDGSCYVWSPHTSSRTFGALWSFHSYHNTVRPDVHDAKRLRKLMMHQRFLCQSKWSKKGGKKKTHNSLLQSERCWKEMHVVKWILQPGHSLLLSENQTWHSKYFNLFFFLGVNQQQLTKANIPNMFCILVFSLCSCGKTIYLWPLLC